MVKWQLRHQTFNQGKETWAVFDGHPLGHDLRLVKTGVTAGHESQLLQLAVVGQHLPELLDRSQSLVANILGNSDRFDVWIPVVGDRMELTSS